MQTELITITAEVKKALQSKIDYAWANKTEGDYFMQRNNFEEIIVVADFDIENMWAEGYLLFSVIPSASGTQAINTFTPTKETQQTQQTQQTKEPVYLYETYINHPNNIVQLFNFNGEILIGYGLLGKNLEKCDKQLYMYLAFCHLNRKVGFKGKSEQEIDAACKKSLKLI